MIDIPAHKFLLQQMLKDYLLGEHMLLLGNQGVGKNKLTDKFLQLLRIEREYIQLHRDTTVQSLLLSPSLEGLLLLLIIAVANIQITGGIIVFEDSPLVKAMKYGRALVIDEIDKAPTEVVCILKVDSLVFIHSSNALLTPRVGSVRGRRNTDARREEICFSKI